MDQSNDILVAKYVPFKFIQKNILKFSLELTKQY